MDPDREPPDPPDVTNRQVPAALADAEIDVELEDLRRGEIETALKEGAWREGVAEWAEYADPDPDLLERAREAGVFGGFDFYFDGETVRAEVPAVPEAVTGDRSGPDRAAFRTELEDLGETVAEVLVERYLDWAAAREEDYVWREETFGTSTEG